MYGKQTKPRDQEPDMYSLLEGGYDHHVNNDYIKDRPHLEQASETGSPNKLAATLDDEKNVAFRINKTVNKHISETRDQFRAFLVDPEYQDLMKDWRDPNDDKGKKFEGRENHWVTMNQAMFGGVSTSLSPERNSSMERAEAEEAARLEAEEAQAREIEEYG